ncbi:MAG TPA: CoA activase [Desulfobacteraceae bacterium]|nr:CoA activase [Desulfobacteraceae bacterium]
MISAGIDCGAKNTKTIIMKDGEIIGKAKVLTGFDQDRAVTQSWEKALEGTGLKAEEVERTCGTGSGKNIIRNADGLVNDIKAIGKAAHYFFPKARTVADVGAEEGRAARLDEKGNAVDFAINDKCAAGAGTFIEAMSRALEIPLDEMGPMANQSHKQITMNAQCAIFVESEAIGLIHANTAKQDISRAIHDAVASRIVSMIRRVGVNEDVVVMGGVACNPGFITAMKKQLALENLYIPDDPEYGMAVGAAVVAAEE